jgi:hypothetical protein
MQAIKTAWVDGPPVELPAFPETPALRQPTTLELEDRLLGYMQTFVPCAMFIAFVLAIIGIVQGNTRVLPFTLGIVMAGIAWQMALSLLH